MAAGEGDGAEVDAGGSPLLPVGALAGAIVSVQLGAAIAKGLFDRLGPQGVTALRLTFGAAILLTALRPWRRPPSRRVWPALIGYGLAMGLMNLCFYLALDRIPLGVAVTVEFIGPLAVALTGSRKAADFAWLGCAAAGLLLLAPRIGGGGPGGAGLDGVGVALALAAGACWAAYIVFSQRVGGEQGAASAAIGAGVGALLILPVGLATAGARMLQPALLPQAVLVGALSSAIPYALEMVALTRMPAKSYGALVSAEPAVAALIGWAWLGERLAARQWLAIALVSVASAGSALTLRRTRLEVAD